ncbi:hypothetical protein ElyMa_001043800, partial [Elysia marginata]
LYFLNQDRHVKCVPFHLRDRSRASIAKATDRLLLATDRLHGTTRHGTTRHGTACNDAASQIIITPGKQQTEGDRDLLERNQLYTTKQTICWLRWPDEQAGLAQSIIAIVETEEATQ